MKTPTPEQIAEARRDAAQFLERGWTQNFYARDAAGAAVSALAPEAVCWCVWGALQRATGVDEGSNLDTLYLAAIDAIRADLRLAPGYALGTWNDEPERTQAEVVAAVRGVN